MHTERKHPRTEREQLLTLVNQWDPAGLIRTGALRGEYDLLIDKLFGLLTREASEAEIAAFLDREVLERFGVRAPLPARFAAKVVAWSRLRSQSAE